MDLVMECGSSSKSGSMQSPPPFSFLASQLNKLSLCVSNLELLKPREVNQANTYNLGPVAPDPADWRRGFRATYLGKETADIRIKGGAQSMTFDCIDRLLQRHNPDHPCDISNGNDVQHELDVYIDIESLDNRWTLVIYDVNAFRQVTQVHHFDLTRISFCTGAVHPGYDHRIVAWLYRQETDTGFQLDCHAVKMPSQARARKLAGLIGKSFERIYADVVDCRQVNKRPLPPIPGEQAV